MKLKKVIAGTVLALLIAGTALGRTENGITVIDQRDMPKGYKGIECVFFNNYDPVGTTTMVYNQAGGTATTSGAVSTRKYTVGKLFQIQPTTIGSTRVNVVFYGQAGTETGWAEIVRYGTGTANTTGEYIPIGENWDRIRVGVQATGTAGADQITVTASMLGEER